MGFRTSFRAGVKTILDTYKSANPTLLAHVYDAPPGQLNTPCAYLEKEVSERYQHTSGLRIRTAQLNVVIVNKQSTNKQVTGEQDALLDGILDALSDDPDAVAGCLIEPVASEDRPIEINGTSYEAVVVTVQGIEQRGR